jgi:hypothetical protein
LSRLCEILQRVRRTLLPLLPVVVALLLFGPELVQPWRGERAPVLGRAPAVVNDGETSIGEVRPRRAGLTARGCFGILRPGIRRPRPGCERIGERRGGVETRLGTAEIPEE